MTVHDLEHLLAQVRKALEDKHLDIAIDLLEELRSPDQADLISELEAADQVAILNSLDPAETADILEELEDEDAVEIANALSAERLALVMDEMEPDEVADLLGDIKDQEIVQKILSSLEDQDEIHPLLMHPDDSAGGLMTSDFLALRRRMTAAEAIQAIRDLDPDSETIHDLYVIDPSGILSGVVDLRTLIKAQPNSTIAEIMEPEVIYVRVGAYQEECARIMAHYDLLTLPVTDFNNKLLGVITIDDVIDVLEDEATEDIQRLGGAEPLEEPYLYSGIFTVTRKRIIWLMLLFITGSLTGTVMRIYQDQLEAIVALSFFIPLLIGTGGNAGSQTTTTIIRALAIGDIDLTDAKHALWHELRVGVLLGAGMGILGYIRAITWDTGIGVAITVALAIFTIVVWANSMGSVLPLLATKFKIDPSLVSGPMMSTLVDATGLLIYFSIAGLILGL